MTWTSSAGGILKFTHLQHEKDKYKHQGKQYALIGFDELTHFTETQFFYLLSRNRSVFVKPYVRATCNPDADSWVAKFIAWWIDDNGFAIPERSGVIRFFYKTGDDTHWADNKEELIKKFEPEMRGLYDKAKKAEWEGHFEDFAKILIKSFTFINSSIFDNKALLRENPEYLASLQSQNKVDRERLLNGNWKIRPSSGMYFKEEYFEFVKALPKNIVRFVRSWDLAASEITAEYPDPDATAGVLMAKDEEGYIYICDLKHIKGTPNAVKKLVKNTAIRDVEKYGKKYTITIPQDPGQAGKAQAKDYTLDLSGFNVVVERPTGDKVTRASPFSAQCEAGNVRILVGDWNDQYISELESFPEAAHDDIVDASADAFNELSNKKKVFRFG